MMILVLLLLLIGISVPVSAQQVDPSAFSVGGSADNANATSNATSTGSDDGMEDHYIKKVVPKKKRSPAKVEESKDDNDDDGDTDTSDNIAAPLPQLTPGNFDGQNSPQPRPDGPTSENFGIEVRDLFLGGDLEQIDKYRSFLDTEDIRKNIFEFSFATSYIYNASTSPYYFRNYLDAFPAMDIGIDLWLTPFLAIDGDYRTSFLSELSDSPTQGNFVTTTNTWFDIGLKFRRFFGMALNSSSMVFGIKYADYNLAVSPTSQSRIGEHTHGLGLSLDVSIPSTKYFFWNLGFEIQPFLTQDENVLNTDLRAGSSSQTFGAGVHIGGEYRLKRTARVFFRLSALLYENQYSGSSLATDPTTGINPTNVNVNNTFYMFDLGLLLGR